MDSLKKGRFSGISLITGQVIHYVINIIRQCSLLRKVAMLHEIITDAKVKPVPVSGATAKVRPCLTNVQWMPAERTVRWPVPLRECTIAPIFSGILIAHPGYVDKDPDGKEVRKVYLECENCFEAVEHEPVEDIVRKSFNNSSVEYSVYCPNCGHMTRIIKLPVDDYEFSGEVSDLSEALNDYDRELISLYEQGIRLP